MFGLRQEFLGKAISPPAVEAIEKAWSLLKDVGALDTAENLTALGRHMVRALNRTVRLRFSLID